VLSAFYVSRAGLSYQLSLARRALTRLVKRRRFVEMQLIDG